MLLGVHLECVGRREKVAGCILYFCLHDVVAFLQELLFLRSDAFPLPISCECLEISHIHFVLIMLAHEILFSLMVELGLLKLLFVIRVGDKI